MGPIEKALREHGYFGTAAELAELADEWRNAGFTDREIMAWIRVDVLEPGDAMNDMAAGFFPADLSD